PRPAAPAAHRPHRGPGPRRQRDRRGVRHRCVPRDDGRDLAASGGLGGWRGPRGPRSARVLVLPAPSAAGGGLSSAVIQRPHLMASKPDPNPIQHAVRTILGQLDPEPGRDGLRDTPVRVESAFRFYTEGYQLDPKAIIGRALFDSETDEMVV